jgi:hypothetical protein
MSHRHYHGLFEAIVVAWIADRARHRYGALPVALIAIGITAFWISPLLGGSLVALAIACGLIWVVLWVLLHWFTAFGNLLSVEAAEERRQARAALDWGAQAWAKIKVAPIHQADRRYHEKILNVARAAIKRGEKPNLVADKLFEIGVDPSSIMRQHGLITHGERLARRAAWRKIARLFVVALCAVAIMPWIDGTRVSRPAAPPVPTSNPAPVPEGRR